MKKYYYRALKNSVELINGYIEANNCSEAKEKIRLMGFAPTDVYEEIAKNSNISAKSQNAKIFNIGISNLFQFSLQLQMLLSSGISLIQSLDNMALHAPNIKIAAFAQNISKSIKSGVTFSEALLPYEKYIGRIYISLCKTGEESGALPEVLKYLTNLLKNKIELRNKFIQLSIYPAILFIMLAGIFFLGGQFLFPYIIETMQVEDVPQFVTYVIFATNFILQNITFLLAVLIAIILLIKCTIGFSSLKEKFVNFLACIPIIRDCMIFLSLSHYMCSMYVSYKSGVPIIDALSLSEETIPVKVIRDKAGLVTQRVKNGASITDSFFESGILPPLMLSMVSTGEISGNLEKMFLDISNAVRQKLDYSLEVLAKIFPVVMLLIAGVGVCAVAVATLQMHISALSSLF